VLLEGRFLFDFVHEAEIIPSGDSNPAFCHTTRRLRHPSLQPLAPLKAVLPQSPGVASESDDA